MRIRTYLSVLNRFAARLLIVFSLGLAACNRSDPKHPRDAHQFSVVDWRAEQVVAEFGQPNRVQRMEKSTEAIWGPAEEFWELISLGQTMVIWSYRVEGGDMELYFIEPDKIVQGVAFAPEGAVYESERK